MLLKYFCGIKEAINEILCTTILGKVEFTSQVTYVDKQMEEVRNAGFQKSCKNLVWYFSIQVSWTISVKNDTYLLPISPQETSPFMVIFTYNRNLIFTFSLFFLLMTHFKSVWTITHTVFLQWSNVELPLCTVLCTKCAINRMQNPCLIFIFLLHCTKQALFVRERVNI